MSQERMNEYVEAAWEVRRVIDDAIVDALAWLIVGSINDHYPHPEAGEEDAVFGTSGCIVNCGPCKALHWLALSQRGRDAVEDAVRRTGYHEGGWAYWDDETGGLRWDWFREYWNGHRGCVFVGGVSQGCDFSGNDDEDEDVFTQSSTPGLADGYCPSCNHLIHRFHSEGGCWYSVTVGKPGQTVVCSCAIELKPRNDEKGENDGEKASEQA